MRLLYEIFTSKVKFQSKLLIPLASYDKYAACILADGKDKFMINHFSRGFRDAHENIQEHEASDMHIGERLAILTNRVAELRIALNYDHSLSNDDCEYLRGVI